jgi:MFS family permease
MDHAGAVVGPLVAWALLTFANRTPSQVVRWSIVPGIVAVLVVIWALKRLPRPAEVDAAEPSQAPQVRSSVALFGLIVAFAFARFPETLLLLRLQDLGVAVALVPILWAALHVVRTIASYPGGWLSDVAGPRSSMVTGWFIYAVVCFGMATAGSGTVAVAWFLLYGLVAAATESPERAFVAALGRVAQRGRRFGIYHAAIGLAALPGALLLGALYAGPGAEWAFALSGTLVVGLGLIGARLK